MEAMPEVAQWARVDVAAYDAILPSGRLALELMAVTDLRGRAGFKLNQFKVISGRMANLHAPGEAMIDFPTADREDLRVGSIIRYIVGSPDANPPGPEPFASGVSRPLPGSSRPSAPRRPLAASM